MNSTIEAFEEVREVREELVSIAKRLGDIIGSAVGISTKKTEEPVSEEPVKTESVGHDGEAVAPKGGKVSQSDLVRSYIKKHADLRNKEIIDLINKDHGVEVAASLVSALRSRERGEKKRGPKGRSRVPAKAVARKTGEVVSDSSLIRECLERNPDASNEDVVKDLKRSKRMEVKPTLVSSVRANLKKKGAKTSRVVSRKPTKAKKNRKGLPMPALVVKVLEKAPREGIKLVDLAEKVIAAGYDYRGSKGPEGVVQNVYQAVHTLSKTIPHAGYEGKTAVVLHDEANKRWKLNPKAVKKDVA